MYWCYLFLNWLLQICHNELELTCKRERKIRIFRFLWSICNTRRGRWRDLHRIQYKEGRPGERKRTAAARPLSSESKGGGEDPCKDVVAAAVQRPQVSSSYEGTGKCSMRGCRRKGRRRTEKWRGYLWHPGATPLSSLDTVEDVENLSRRWDRMYYCVFSKTRSSLGTGSPARPENLGPRPHFWPDGRAWAAETRPDCWLGSGLGSIFDSFWKGPTRKPDGPTKNISLGPGLGRFFRPDSRAGPVPPFSVSGFSLARSEKMPRYRRDARYKI
jgi:hypothetical protein